MTHKNNMLQQKMIVTNITVYENNKTLILKHTRYTFIYNLGLHKCTQVGFNLKLDFLS